jgi:hypothetical protein
MAENKKSIVIYSDWQSIFEQLDDLEAGKLIKHFFNYVNDKNPELEDRLLKMAFEPMKLQLKRDLSKWEQTKLRRSEAGKKGGLKSGEVRKNEANEAIASNDKQNEANEAVTVNDIVTVNGTVTVTDILSEKEKENLKKTYSKNETYGIEVLKDLIWIETVAMQSRITPEEIPKWIDSFNKKLIREFDVKVSKQEYASHFSRWVPTEILKLKKTNGNGNQKNGTGIPTASFENNR